MITLRKGNERGHTEIGWLDSYHTFSFGDYDDPKNRGFRVLRVINEDRVEPEEGFDTHPHRDMEIITYILEGELEHQDNMGTGSIIRPGDIQRMTAGTGVLHSEKNPSDSKPVRLLQIWIFPDQKGLKPSYEQKNFSNEEKNGKWRLVDSPDGKEGSVTIHQDARLYRSLLPAGQTVNYENPEGRYVWIQVAKGKAFLNGKQIEQGDGVAVTGRETLKLEGETQSEFLLFDLP
jgi:redox-sensitive bicupin YhaK (pirin superfamily)